MMAIALLMGLFSLPPVAAADSAPGFHPDDLASLETIEAEVLQVEYTSPWYGSGHGGVHLQMETTAGELLEVRLGPVWYLADQQFEIAAGDRLEIKGNRLPDQTPGVIVASSIQRDNRLLILQDEYGFPAWQGMPGGRGWP